MRPVHLPEAIESIAPTFSRGLCRKHFDEGRRKSIPRRASRWNALSSTRWPGIRLCRWCLRLRAITCCHRLRRSRSTFRSRRDL